MSGFKDRRTRVVVAVLGVVAALVGLLAGVRILSDNNDSSSRSQDRTTNEYNNNNSIDGNCNAMGDDAEACTEGAEDPAVEIVKGPTPDTYALRTVNWEPQTTIAIKVVMSDGRPGSMGDNAKKTTNASGAYTNEPGHWFWKIQEGEPSGTYRVEVSGTAVGGKSTTKVAEFDVP